MDDSIPGYKIVKKLGDGARSEVYQAIRTATGERFAFKRVIRDETEDARFLDQAINEHQVASQLSHPVLRKSFELRRIRRLFRLVEIHALLEFVDGVSLDRSRPERVAKAVEIFRKVADGLGFMHGQGFLHTDIKPNNILVAYDGGVKIIDFGQSCTVGYIKPRIQGTPDYIAPEQVERKRLTPQTDVFNFGATLYWTLTNTAFPTVIAKRGRRQQTRGLPSIPTPRELNPQVPEALSRLVMECCRYDPTLRPEGMGEVIGRLDASLEETGAGDLVPGSTAGRRKRAARVIVRPRTGRDMGAAPDSGGQRRPSESGSQACDLE